MAPRPGISHVAPGTPFSERRASASTFTWTCAFGPELEAVVASRVVRLRSASKR